jgi:hypothetical protein
MIVLLDTVGCFCRATLQHHITMHTRLVCMRNGELEMQPPNNDEHPSTRQPCAAHTTEHTLPCVQDAVVLLTHASLLMQDCPCKRLPCTHRSSRAHAGRTTLCPNIDSFNRPTPTHHTARKARVPSLCQVHGVSKCHKDEPHARGGMRTCQLHDSP